MHAKTTSSPIQVVLIGGSGYTGFEVIRLLARHPHAELVGVFGPENELGPMDEFFPLLTGLCDLRQELFDIESVKALSPDLAMLCVPHKVAMQYTPSLRDAGIRVIDWSADYRISNQAIYEQWYCPHTDAERLDEAVYGLCEMFADQIPQADLVANPGCYPTAATLAIAPVLRAGLIEPTGIVVNAVSGVSGGGRTPGRKFHFPDRNENFEAYGVGTHRHMPEIEQVVGDLTGREIEALFVPHLSPMDRGILESIYCTPTGDVAAGQILEVYHEAYDGCPFVRVRNEPLPATKYVAQTNFCDVSARVAKGKVILFSALDNLLKGASGQAVQNMNLMFGFQETAGLL
jgi:N-acetyl-gamma-glutamyl-phosphate reductase